MKSARLRWIIASVVLTGLVVTLVLGKKRFFPTSAKFLTEQTSSNEVLTKDTLAAALAEHTRSQKFPTEIDLPVRGAPTRVIVQYSIDNKLQEAMEGLFRSYSPDYGALVAIEPSTGRILSLVSYSQDDGVVDNLALRATFPSASVFKVVTAAAAIAERRFSCNTVIPFNGRNHTLYRSNILNTHVTRWTRYMTLKDAFAHSVNTVFGKIGAFNVGAAELRQYATRFGFNRAIASDVPVQVGHALITDDPWELAESASGYTRDNTMSPLQGALIAAAIANDGSMMEPFMVQSVHALDGTPLYQAKAKVASVAVDPATAAEIRQLMKATVERGTSRRSFRGFFKGAFSYLDVGGKTGSLTGDNPPGKYDWFVGFADDGQHRLAIAALTVHKKYWKVKSSYLARKAIENYYHEILPRRAVAAAPALVYAR